MLRILFICSFFILLNSIHAEIVKEISISGNTKTKEWAILKRVNLKIGDDLSPEDLEDLRIRLSQNPQFILKKINLAEGKLSIDIEDKWSVIPVPLISQSGEYYMRGAGIYDNNFLGRMELFVPAIAWTNSGLNYLVLWNSENYFSPTLGISSLFVHLNTMSHFYRNEKKVQTFETRTSAAEITPNIFWKNQVFKIGPIGFTKTILPSNSLSEINESGGGIRARYNIKMFEQQECLPKGWFITTNWYLLKRSKQSDPVLHAKFEWNGSYPILDSKNYFNLEQNVGYVSDAGYFYPFSEGAHEGFRGYDGESLTMRKYSATTLQYQQHIWDRFYALAFYEKTYSQLIRPVYNGKSLNEDTIGTGVRYYLKKVSIPGINLEYAYNTTDKSHHIHFNLGLKL